MGKPDAVFEGRRSREAVWGACGPVRPYVTEPEANKHLSFTVHLETSLDLPISDSIMHCALEITKAPPQKFARWKRIASDSMFTNIVSAICFSESAGQIEGVRGELTEKIEGIRGEIRG